MAHSDTPVTEAGIDSPSPWKRWGAILLLAACYLFVWWYADPVQLAHDRQRPFLLDSIFFYRLARHAGGLIEYVGSFWVQSYHIAWFGSLLITGALLLHAVCLRTLLSLLYSRWASVLAAFVTVYLLVMFRYYLTLVSVLAILMALVLACGYAALRRVPLPGRIVLFFLMALLVAYAAAGAVLLFVFMAAVIETVTDRRRWLALVLLALGALVPVAVRAWCFEPAWLPFFFRWFPMDRALITLPLGPILLTLLYPASILTVAFAHRFMPTGPLTVRGRRIERWGGMIIAALALAVMTHAGFHFQHTDAMRHADRLMEAERWSEALSLLRPLPIDGEASRHIAIRCLANQGRLLDELFQYPQVAGTDPILLNDPALDTTLRAFRKRSEIYYELGLVNESERWAHEALTDQGEIPFLLNRIALINVLRDRPGAARIFLNSLARNPWYRQEAFDRLAQLDRDPLLSGDPAVARVRTLMPSTDYVGPWATDEILQHALATNPGNTLAYDYLLAHYLLQRRLDAFAAWIGRYRDYHARMPRHCEEACLAWIQRTRQIPAGLERWQADPGTIQRFQSFVATYSARRRTTQEAWDATATGYGDTFWFYDLFGRTAAGPPVTPADFDTGSEPSSPAGVAP